MPAEEGLGLAMPAEEGLGLAIANRLRRAAGPRPSSLSGLQQH
ncbi:hypothetical protein [Streptomyces flaveolus]